MRVDLREPTDPVPAASATRDASLEPETDATSFAAHARTALERCDELGRCSEEPRLLVRRALTTAHAEANARCATWMR